MRLRFRNTYKNKKIMLVYLIISIFALIISLYTFMFAMILKPIYLKILFHVITILLVATFCFTFFLICLENNNYKLKYFLLRENKQKIKEFCLVMELNKTQTKEKTIEMIDNYRQTGNVYGQFDLIHLFNRKQDIFKYTSATEKEKLDYIIYSLKCNLNDLSDTSKFKNKLLNSGFSEKEILEVIDEEYMCNNVKTIIKKLLENKATIKDFYVLEPEINFLTKLASGTISLDQFKKETNSDYIYAPLRHTRFLVRNVEDNTFTYEAQTYSQSFNWTSVPTNIITSKEIVEKEIELEIKKLEFQEVWDFVWFGYVSNFLPINFYHLLDYYSAIQSEGHFIYFNNNSNELDQITESLKSLLPEDLFENFQQAKEHFLNNVTDWDTQIKHDKICESKLAEVEKLIYKFAKDFLKKNK